MANSRLLIVIVAGGVASAINLVSDEGLLLLQSHAQELRVDATEARLAQNLPTVGEVMSRPKSIFEQMNVRFGELEERLAATHASEAAAITRAKAAFEHNLTIERERNRAIRQQNAQLSARIKRVKKVISQLRQNASKLRRLNDDLVLDLKTMETNWTTAQDYVSQSLGQSTDMLDNAPELLVLRELQEQDDLHRQEVDHAQRLQLLGPARDLALLETQSESNEPSSARDAQGLLDMLSSALDDLSKEHNNSQAMLREEFEKEFQKATERRSSLLTEQELLNTTLAVSLGVKENITAAVAHLRKTHEFLSQRAHALRAFAAKLGSKAESEDLKGYSMLQMEATRNQNQMPDIQSVLKRPSQTFDQLTSHVAELQQRVAEANRQGILDAQAKKAEYDGILHKLEQSNTAQRRKNREVANEVAQLNQSIGQLRKQTQDTMNSNDEVRAELKLIQANITLMQEFLAKSLEVTNDSIADTPELLVIAELQAQDQAKSLETSRAQRLDQILKEKVALLQFDNAESVKAMQQDLLDSLSQSMNTLMDEHQGSLQQLKEAFEKDLAVRQQHNQDLIQKWLQLNATRAAQKELEHRLQVALLHVQKTGETLKKRRSSLLGYARRLADRSKQWSEEAGDRTMPKPLQNPQALEKKNSTDTSVSMPGIVSFRAFPKQPRKSTTKALIKLNKHERRHRNRTNMSKTSADLHEVVNNTNVSEASVDIRKLTPKTLQKAKNRNTKVNVSSLVNDTLNVKPEMPHRSKMHKGKHSATKSHMPKQAIHILERPVSATAKKDVADDKAPWWSKISLLKFGSEQLARFQMAPSNA